MQRQIKASETSKLKACLTAVIDVEKISSDNT